MKKGMLAIEYMVILVIVIIIIIILLIASGSLTKITQGILDLL